MVQGGEPDRWRVLIGSDNWTNLLDPLDIDLRKLLIRYGELAQATSDALITERTSPYAGACKFSRESILSKCHVSSKHIYQVTKFVYATAGMACPDDLMIRSLSREAWCKESNWMGFVAVATDEGKEALGRRDIVVAWRGTQRPLEWLNDFDFSLVPAGKLFRTNSEVMVHKGFLSVYMTADEKSKYNKMSARDQVLGELKRLIELYKDDEISIIVTGHSLGASLTTLNALDIVANGINKPKTRETNPFPVTAFAFASPKVGDSTFKQIYEVTNDLRILRIRNTPDVVPTYPFVFYEEVGKQLEIDTTKSMYIKSPGDFAHWHNGEAYLHGIAGTQGNNEFRLVVDRDIALLNKSYDTVKDEYLVPVSWWVQENKGMVQLPNGHWILKDHELESDH